MKKNRKNNYNAISKNGDTLELSEAGRTQGVYTEKKNSPLSGRSGIANSGKMIPDVALTGYVNTKSK